MNIPKVISSPLVQCVPPSYSDLSDNLGFGRWTRKEIPLASEETVFGCGCTVASCIWEHALNKWLTTSLNLGLISQEDLGHYAHFMTTSGDSASIETLMNKTCLTVEQLILLDRWHRYCKDKQSLSAYWHTFCNRNSAETLLLQSSRDVLGLSSDDPIDGIFIIRPTSSHVDNLQTKDDIEADTSGQSLDQPIDNQKEELCFCISLRYRDMCYHYRLFRTNHCMFRLEGQNRLFHGIDEFVKYHQSNPHGMKTCLTKPIKGCILNDFYFRFGEDNILHKCCADTNEMTC